jgi:hemoglobin
MDDPVAHVSASVGETLISATVAAFYRRVAIDDILRPMYPADDLTGAERRLADFLIGRFGGPQRYVETRGHPRLRMRHARFPIGLVARDRWMQLMNQAMAEVAFPEPERRRVREFLSGVASSLINRA